MYYSSKVGTNIHWLVVLVWNFLYFFHIRNNNPNWLILFGGVETTNQYFKVSFWNWPLLRHEPFVRGVHFSTSTGWAERPSLGSKDMWHPRNTPKNERQSKLQAPRWRCLWVLQNSLAHGCTHGGHEFWPVFGQVGRNFPRNVLKRPIGWQKHCIQEFRTLRLVAACRFSMEIHGTSSFSRRFSEISSDRFFLQIRSKHLEFHRFPPDLPNMADFRDSWGLMVAMDKLRNSVGLSMAWGETTVRWVWKSGAKSGVNPPTSRDTNMSQVTGTVRETINCLGTEQSNQFSLPLKCIN